MQVCCMGGGLAQGCYGTGTEGHIVSPLAAEMPAGTGSPCRTLPVHLPHVHCGAVITWSGAHCQQHTGKS
jgi:hypothetical protein